MKRIIFTALLCLMACGEEKHASPKNLIPSEQMSKILADIHLAEAKAQLMGYKTADSGTVAFIELRKSVLAKHKVNSADYDSSYAYYSKQLKEFNKIYEAAIDTLNIRQSRLADL